MLCLWHALSHLNTEVREAQHIAKRARIYFWSLFLAHGESSQSSSEKLFT